MAERPIGYWLKLVDRLIDERFAAILEEHGVTRRQWQLLGIITTEGTPVDLLDSAIAPFLPSDGSETSADHLDELIESDWLDFDGELYKLTERGQQAFGRLSTVVGELRGAVGDGVSEDDYTTTLATLELMARNLGYTNSADTN
ncbi:hypothetical protein FB562_2251 [Homoserinimonas aerilata]|uniref:DNA-binding MarR family transcriptional regulator n=1 Tax=Homoserinimonas aerilata TaxID=1162970 RepID=A0A542YF57_9MICO|nr:MarR family transcriptional regulator [Homoserinimonas aerilata]TQL46726.1 hypothetical protein FB562_2251 [Homoserinimonas aerilata]